MITNERQYKITKRQLRNLRKAIREFDLPRAAQQSGSQIFAEAQLQALRSEEDTLASQMREYDDLKSGGIKIFKASSLDELPKLLIQARIAKRMTQRELALRIGVKEQQIQRYESDDYSTAGLRRLREIAEALDLRVTELAEFKPDSLFINSLKDEELDWSKFPIKEMYKRQWFDGFSGSLDSALRNAESLVADFIKDVFKRPALAFHRKHIRSGSQIDQYALFAWECRVLKLAAKTELGSEYQKESIDSDWLAEFVKESRRPDGPLRASKMLASAGIVLIVEPHLPKTYLDGAALLHGELPVIGMTLRYDRLDNFWFVLFHELIHVIEHLQKGKIWRIFDDLDEESGDSIEQEADNLAREAQIPTDVWNDSLARFVQSEESVSVLAADLDISTAIVAGRIRYESNNFVILNKLVGQGEVRKHFQSAAFGA